MSKFAKKESYTPEDVESMIDAAIDSLPNEKTREKKTGESALDKFKGKGAKDMAADGNVGSPKEADITPEEEGHDDASKAAKVTKPAKARNAGDQLSNGDKTIVKGGTK